MRYPLAILTTTLLTAPAIGQLRLAERLATPLIHFEASAPTEGERSVARIVIDDPSVRSLLESIGLRSGAPGGAESPIDQLCELIDLSTGEFELAVCEVFGADLPSMICRFHLSAARSQSIGAALAAGALTRPHRRIGQNRTHVMKSVASDFPDEVFEVALVGRDLVVGNDADIFEALLLSPGKKRRSGRRDTLAAEPGFSSLLRRVSAGPGSAVLSLDWRRIGPDLMARASGAQRPVLRALGLAESPRIVVGLDSVRSRASRSDGGSSLATTILLDLSEGARGVFRVAKEEPVRKLVERLPAFGVGSMVLAVDQRRLPTRSAHTSVVSRDRQFGDFARFGVDFDRIVLPALDGALSVQLVQGERDAMTGVISLQARDRRQAHAIFENLELCLASSVDGSPSAELVQVDSKGRKDPRYGERVLQLTDGLGGAIGAIDSRLVYAPEANTLAALAELERAASKSRPRYRQEILRHLKRMNVDRANGVFRIDRAKVAHAGAIFVESELVRIEVLSPM